MSASGASETAKAVAGLVARVRAGQVRALARAISLVEDGAAGAAELVAACRVAVGAERGAAAGRALRVGITGAPGVGKSSLVDGIARELRRRGKSVAVLAVDPTSPVTGGALLGDRIRMQAAAVGVDPDAGLYIRSMASRGERGGLAAAVADAAVVLEAAGWEVILLETMGVGQDEVEVARLADVTVLVLVPGMGDGVQSLKAGIMEVADVYVVNKSDRGGAERVEAEIVGMQGLVEAEGWVAPVVRTSALNGEGVAELVGVVEGCLLAQAGEGRLLAQTRPVFDVADAAPKTRQPELPGVTGLRLDHLGVAVWSIAAAREFYEGLGLRVAGEETVEAEGVRVAMVLLGEVRIELLESVGEGSVVGRFLARRGEGLHHIALRCEDLEGTFARLQARGARLVSERIGVGAGGHRYFFVHPASTGGVLVEMVAD
jgi:LAO/AO transport system kinase